MPKSLCKKCKRQELLIKVLKQNIMDLSNFYDYIADNYPETDEKITAFLDKMADRQILFNKQYAEKIVLNKKKRRKYY